MKNRFLIFIFLMIMAIVMLPQVVLAADADGNGYDDYDFTMLQTFLDQTTSSGLTNGQTINPSYDSTDPTTWGDLTWDTSLPVQTILRINWWDQNLEGTLDLSGCTTLQYLDCTENSITQLNVSGDTALDTLYCSVNGLTSLDISGDTALQQLQCQDNHLISLDISTNTALQNLNCINNDISSLNLNANPALTQLGCDNNQLTSLDIDTNTLLTEVDCNNNGLGSLNVNLNPLLQTLTCAGNHLSSLNVGTNTALQTLDCSMNQISLLDVHLNMALQYLLCSDNQLATLDVDSNPALLQLICANNALSSLDIENNTALQMLSCANNSLSSLDISHNTDLGMLMCGGNHLSNLNVGALTGLQAVDCSNNALTQLDLSNNATLMFLDCSTNPLAQINVKIDGGGAVSLTAVGDGYVELYSDIYGTGEQYAKALPKAPSIFVNWTASGAAVSSNAKYDLATASAYHLNANFGYTVTFDKNGGDTEASPRTATVISGNTISAPATPPARAGYNFGGWYKEAACTTAWNFTTDSVSALTTLYARWTSTVSFDMQGHGTQIDPQTISTGGLVTKPGDPTAAGFAFGGWYKDAALSQPWDFAGNAVIGNTALYAKWSTLSIKTLSLFTNGRAVLTPSHSDGTWSYDRNFIQLTQNSDGTVTIKALKAGTTTVTFTTVNSIEQYNITTLASDLPETGQNSTAIYILTVLSVLIFIAATGIKANENIK